MGIWRSALQLTFCWHLQLQAARLPCGSLDRLLKVTAFTVSIYSCVYRPYVPFRSPAGETSECIAPDKGIRAIAEKVSCPCHRDAAATQPLAFISLLLKTCAKGLLGSNRVPGWTHTLGARIRSPKEGHSSCACTLLC